MKEESSKKKRGPAKKPGYRQELRVTPSVEELFEYIKNKYNFTHNSEALHKVAQIFLSNLKK